MVAYKRVAIGGEIVEWDDEELIARRYEVTDISHPLEHWRTGRLIQRWIPTSEAWEKLWSVWLHQGMVVVNK